LLAVIAGVVLNVGFAGLHSADTDSSDVDRTHGAGNTPASTSTLQETGSTGVPDRLSPSTAPHQSEIENGDVNGLTSTSDEGQVPASTVVIHGSRPSTKKTKVGDLEGEKDLAVVRAARALLVAGIPLPMCHTIALYVVSRSSAKQALRGVQPTTVELFYKLNTFYKNKLGFKEIVEHVDPDGLLCGIEVAVVGLFSGKQIKVEFYQRQVDGTPVRSIKDLYRVAEAVLPMFQTFLCDIASEAGVKVKLAPLKDKDRAKEKGDSDYADRECPNGSPVIGWVFDIVRGTLVCDSAEQIEAVVKLLVADKRVKKVIKFKNRFKNPTPNGLCDMLVQIVFSGGGNISHVCEVQVHLRQIKEYAIENKSHEAYGYFRVFFDGSMNTVASRLEDLAAIVGNDFSPAKSSKSAAEVMEDIVTGVLASREPLRWFLMAELCREYLSEYDLAVFFYKKEIKWNSTEYGPASEAVTNTINLLALTLQIQGKLGEALEMYEKNLAIQLRTLGPEHSNVAASYVNTGVVFQSQERIGEAMEMYEKALVILLKRFGSSHSAVGKIYSNMGTCLMTQNKLEASLEMLEKSLAIQLKTLGPEHKDLATTYLNIGATVQRQLTPPDAVEKYKKELVNKMLTQGIMSIAQNNSLVIIPDTAGKLRKAMTAYEKALAIQLKTLGPVHTSVADTYFMMGMLFLNQTKLREALEMFEKALAIRLKTLGPEHISVAQAYLNMGHVLEGQDKLGYAL
jgi:tetratricopeptide (TPR) repeat protein